MKHLLLSILMAVSLTAADATGTWTGTLMPAGGEGTGLPAHVVLKQEGTKLSGTAGPNVDEQRPISNGKAENGTLSFELANDNSVMKFALKQDGDMITGDVSRERDGQTQTATINLKRSK